MGELRAIRMTYEEWEKQHAAAECNTNGHEFEVSSDLSGEPVGLYCARACGAGPWPLDHVEVRKEERKRAAWEVQKVINHWSAVPADILDQRSSELFDLEACRDRIIGALDV